jgi:hypothetical protein
MCSTTDWRYCLRQYALFKFIDSLCISCCKIEHTFQDRYNLFVIIWYYGLSKCRVMWRMWGAKWMKQFKLVMSVSSPYLYSWDHFLDTHTHTHTHTLQSNWLESNWSEMNLLYLYLCCLLSRNWNVLWVLQVECVWWEAASELSRKLKFSFKIMCAWVVGIFSLCYCLCFPLMTDNTKLCLN